MATPSPAIDEKHRTLEVPATMPSIHENEQSVTTPTVALSDAVPTPPKSVEFAPRTKEFWFIPIPKSRRYDPERPIHFGLFLNVIFGAASTFSMYANYLLLLVLLNLYAVVANLYYNNPLLSASCSCVLALG